MADPMKDTTDNAVSQLVVNYGTRSLGHVVGSGECWDLPYEALRFAKANTPHELGNDLYVWGQRIENLNDAQPGDLLQFEGVRMKREWVTGDGVKHWEEFNFGERHSAIVEKIDGGLFFTILNAHVNKKKAVTRLRINLSAENIQRGTIYLYRPTVRRAGK